MATNEEQIKQLVERWAEAVRNKDMEGILAQHSADMVMYDVPKPFKSVGIDAYRKTWDTFYRFTKLGVFDIQTLDIVAGDDVAFCYAEMKCADNSDGKGFAELDFRLTVGLRKVDGEWVVVHEHHSVPSE